MLGFAKDNIEVLDKAIKYLQVYKEKVDANIRTDG